MHDLAMVLSVVPELEIMALDSCECFDDNKAYVRKRLAVEKNQAVRKLLAADLEFLDEVQVGMSSAREFLFIYRFRKEKEEQAREKERSIQQAVLDIRRKYGKNALLKGMNLEEGATAMERNRQVGGHKA